MPSRGPVRPSTARFGIDAGSRTLWSDGALKSNWTGPSGEIRAGQTGHLELQFANPRIAWLIDLRVNDDGCSATIASTVRNNGAAPVILGRYRLADYSDNGAKLDIGPGAENTLWLAMTGSQADSRVQKVQSAHKRRSSKILAEGLPSAKWRELVAMGG
ncbi:MAG: hypothetical protein ACJ73N_09665 [Bryobacteraceae bacterium]